MQPLTTLDRQPSFTCLTETEINTQAKPSICRRYHGASYLLQSSADWSSAAGPYRAVAALTRAMDQSQRCDGLWMPGDICCSRDVSSRRWPQRGGHDEATSLLNGMLCLNLQRLLVSHGSVLPFYVRSFVRLLACFLGWFFCSFLSLCILSW